MRTSDSKALRDARSNEPPQDDKKSAVEMLITEEVLKRMEGRVPWAPRNFNPAGGLTKLKDAHMVPLIDLLRTGFYHLRVEKSRLQDRAAEKEKVGYKKRFEQTSRALAPGQVLTHDV